jgi:hypothetical protein
MGDAIALAMHRCDDLAILGDHQVDDLADGGGIEAEAIRVDCFGGQRFPLRCLGRPEILRHAPLSYSSPSASVK